VTVPRLPGQVDLYMNAFTLLKMSDHIKQVARLWVAPRPQHPHEALGRPAGLLAQRLKANRGIDVIAQDRLAGLRVAGQKALQGFG
jgi:hypothetical protein